MRVRSSTAAERVRVLVVDDDASVRELVGATLARDERVTVVASASDGAHAIDLVEAHAPDVVVMDVHMPRMDGCEATERIVRAYPDVIVVALTGAADVESVTRMIVAGAVGYAVKSSLDSLADVVVDCSRQGYFVDPSALDELFESIVRLAREEHQRRAEAERLAAELSRAYKETIAALANALRSRDHDTEEHGDRVAERVVAVGRLLGLTDEQLVDLEYAALFHDIGKIAMPDAILHNTDELTDAQWALVRQHTVIGEEILQPVGFLSKVARIVRHSHEHWDGSGYPDALVGEAIPIESRIVFACDALDAMTSTRTYQRAMSLDAAIDRMRELRGHHFDPRVVDALVTVLDEERARGPQPASRA